MIGGVRVRTLEPHTDDRRSRRGARAARLARYPVPVGLAVVGEIVVLPARNEGPRIGAVLIDLRRSLPDATVVVVDDASSDRTADVAREGGAVVVTHPIH